MNSRLGLPGDKDRPAKALAPTPTQTGLLEAEGPSKMASQGKLVLVVDDFKDDREMYAYFLSIKGFRVTLASDGEEALVKAFQVHPDAIILDLWMPGIGGWEALRRLKSDAKTRNIPVVVLTARDFVSAKAVGSDSCLIKPCPPDILLAEINRVLNREAASDLSLPQTSN
jgi:two-component system, cell cycle response regulator DivK